MNTIFDCLIDSYVDNKVGLAENFLSLELAANLKTNLKLLYANDELKSAGIGNNAKATQNKLVRSDKIYWLDPAHENVFEQQFFVLIDAFVLYLNRHCFTGITGYEFHYALYENGTFYKRHLDQFQHSNSRAFSMIMYLNSEWKVDDGGELCIFHSDNIQMIAPTNGKCVFFKSSELEHEVCETQQPRLSITGWLRTDI